MDDTARRARRRGGALFSASFAWLLLVFSPEASAQYTGYGAQPQPVYGQAYGQQQQQQQTRRARDPRFQPAFVARISNGAGFESWNGEDLGPNYQLDLAGGVGFVYYLSRTAELHLVPEVGYAHVTDMYRLDGDKHWHFGHCATLGLVAGISNLEKYGIEAYGTLMVGSYRREFALGARFGVRFTFLLNLFGLDCGYQWLTTADGLDAHSVRVMVSFDIGAASRADPPFEEEE